MISRKRVSHIAMAGLITAIGGSAAAPITHAATNAPTVASNGGVQKIAAANTSFGLKLLGKLSQEKPRDNVFFSPFSISQALTLALNGSGGKTRQQIAGTLGLSGIPLDGINAANGLLLPSLRNPEEKVTLSIGNALWADKATKLKPDFQARSSKFYGAQTASLDFSSPAAAARINGWVSKETHGKITSIVTPGALRQSPAVLTNAVYFHGTWSEVFKPHNTHDEPFKLGAGAKKIVPMMSQTSRFKYAQNAKFQSVRLPYGQGRIAFYVFLPKDLNGLDALVKSATPAQWNAWIAKMKPTQLQVELPKFKASQDIVLNKPLTELGMVSAFHAGADFRPMGLTNGYIGSVIHKAVLNVDEEGTTAAAATGVMMATAAMLPPPVQIKVDHPFLCAIRDDTTGEILFAGLIRDPK